ncbi:MAG: peptidase inhibitor family I36 protein, partial [Chloroflexota bacterium]|nr:peptidase inhibitor family I36 protein [Chloroflexota bacterium]
ACPAGVLAAGAERELPADVPADHPRAELDGHEISLPDVVGFHCNDLAAPLIRCFTSEAARDADIGQLAGSDALSFSASSVVYVLAYEAINYGGSSIALSQPETDLSSLGWNDVISSFKSTNGGHPRWWEAANYQGGSWQWGKSFWVAYVGDAANDRFSSVQNYP